MLKTVKIRFSVFRSFDSKEIASGSIKEKTDFPTRSDSLGINDGAIVKARIVLWKKMLETQYSNTIHCISVSGTL